MYLTHDVRTAIVKSAIIHAFGARYDEHVKDHATLAKSLYEDIFWLAAIKRMNDLPVGWLPTVTYITIQTTIAGDEQRFHFCGSPGRRNGAEWTLFFKYLTDVHMRIPYSKQGGILKSYASHAGVSFFTEKRNKLRTEIIETERRLNATLAKYRAVKGLLKEWPEIEPFIPVKSKPVENLPSLPREELNAILKLPVTA